MSREADELLSEIIDRWGGGNTNNRIDMEGEILSFHTFVHLIDCNIALCYLFSKDVWGMRPTARTHVFSTYCNCKSDKNEFYYTFGINDSCAAQLYTDFWMKVQFLHINLLQQAKYSGAFYIKRLKRWLIDAYKYMADQQTSVWAQRADFYIITSAKTHYLILFDRIIVAVTNTFYWSYVDEKQTVQMLRLHEMITLST